MTFKNSYSFNDRSLESHRIIMKYPDRIPIICERSQISSNDCPSIDKNKFLVPNDFTLGQFIFVIRKRMKLPPEKAIFLFINDIYHNSTQLLSNIYDSEKDDDGFLYISYSFENTFGCTIY